MKFKETVSGKAKLGIQAFADSLLIVPKVLASNSGFDVQDTILKLIEAAKKSKTSIGINLEDGEPLSPEAFAIYDNYCVKKQFLDLAPVLAEQLLLVDEVIKAGIEMKKAF